MSHKTAVFLAEAIESHEIPYPIQCIELAGIDLGDLGIRRISELLCTNPELKMIMIGPVSDAGLKIMAEHMPNFLGLQTLCFECAPETKWNKETMAAFIGSFKKNEVLMDVKVEGENAKGFVKELEYHALENRKKANMKNHFDISMVAEKIFACVM